MPKDRINDLKRDSVRPNILYRRLSRQLNRREAPSPANHGQRHSTIVSLEGEPPIGGFLAEITEIGSTIDRIDELALQIKQLYVELLRTTDSIKIGQDIDGKCEEIKRLHHETLANLRRIEQGSDDLDQSIAHRRIKESQVFVLTRRLQTTMIEYDQEAAGHRERCKHRLIYELKLTGNRRTNEELDEILENGCNGSLNFAILVDAQKDKRTLGHLQARHQDLLKLESSIRELHEMIRDLATFVSQQGEMIDCIEHNVAKAADYVEDAAEDVDRAGKYREAALKKKIIVYVALICIVLLILFLAFFGFFVNRKILG